METAFSGKSLLGRWTHAHEEDSPGTIVFRSAEVPLPPSRGRTSFELRDDGTVVERTPDAVDRSSVKKNRWTLDEKGVIQFLDVANGQPTRKLQIVRFDGDRLVLKKN